MTDRFPAAPLPTTAPVHVVGTATRQARDITIARAAAPTRAALGVPIAVTVDLQRADTVAKRTSVQLIDRGAVTATTSVRWEDRQLSARAVLTFIPPRTGALRLRVAAEDQAVDVLTDVRARRFAVRVTGPRASWNLAFATAALREDDRLSVSSLIETATGRALVSRPETAAQSAERPDALLRGVDSSTSPADVDLIRRTAERGAAVVLVSDGVLSAALRDLIGASRVAEHVVVAPLAASNGLRAGEWLLLDGLNPAAGVRATFRARGRDYPAVTDIPVGEGRIAFVAALDAWRFRADPAFERFWRGLVVELAAEQSAVSARLHVSPEVARPGESLVVTYESPKPVRTNTLPVRVLSEGDGGSTHTLVANGGRFFVGRFRAPLAEGTYQLTSSGTNDLTADSVPLLVTRDASVVVHDDERTLRAVATAHRGTFVHADELATVVDTLRRGLPASLATTSARPMEWPGWVVIFTALVGTEWWLRRRNGLR